MDFKHIYHALSLKNKTLIPVKESMTEQIA